MFKYLNQYPKFISLLTLIVILTSMPTSAADTTLNEEIDKTIALIKTTTDLHERVKAAEHLSEIMIGVDAESIDKKTITELESLLNVDDYDVQKFATIALGQLGRKSDKPNPVLNKILEEAIVKTQLGKSLDERIGGAESICEIMPGKDPMYVSDKTIADIISLLDNNPNDGIIACVSAALGIFGPRSKAAAPKLLAMLPAIDCLGLHQDVDSAGFIRLALKRMGVKPPPFDPKKCK